MTITSVLSARDKIGYGLGDMASALLGMARKRDLNNAGESLSSSALNNAIQE
ncbi:hypothetical protein INP82_03665 [Citrobacter sedlakii]|uniref:hypothetical protein n=1 Tax=Citrobacter TaxID=544 RepID=UPI000A91B05A|nr:MULTISPECIES: hypothetical protein [Citrobacter]MBM9566526.1 hypothetical protein [Citrobacter sedlakii]HBL4689335.1 hypothetical protein [Citrobacter sedlakii]HBL4703774.1 hypothetical protein [Citrobacter sedlakii]HBL4717872.1 hypothetical protein [Citrobacter sedlakii]HBL4722278.1 hypothetical protein [Citrobacter sedlakii]